MTSMLNSFARFMVSATFIVLVLPVLYLAWPVRRIRIGSLNEERIGHLITNPFLHLRKLRLYGGPKRTSYIFIAGKPANHQAMEMVKRQMIVLESPLLRRISFCILPVLKRTRFHVDLPEAVPAHDLYSVDIPRPSFTDQEEARGQAELRRMGIGPEDWFVCIHNRDPAYLGQNWNDVRDCEIEPYVPAAHWIAEQGGFVLRMGHVTAKQLNTNEPRIIDYANTCRSDFMDMYLLSHCRFFLGNTSGPVCVPVLMGIPTGMANKMPYYLAGMGKWTIFIPKLLRRIDTGQIMTFPEIKRLGLFAGNPKKAEGLWRSATYYDNNIEILDNSAEDILDFAKDLMDWSNDTHVTAEQARLQVLYHSLHDEGHDADCAGMIGPRFIWKYRHLLEGC